VEIKNKFLNAERINIVHLPSNKLLKGTDFVFNAIDALKKRGFEFNFIHKRVPHTEIPEILSKCHILIDQFTIGPGLLSTEGMAHGCVVICRLSNWFKEDFPDIPLLSCETDELTEVLINLIQNPNKMAEIALNSYAYFQKYHTHEAAGKYYKKELGFN